MQNISPQQANEWVVEATFLSCNELDRLQHERLQELMGFVRERSPYLKEKYRSLPAKPDLTEIPVSLRSELVAKFDEWVTDPEVHEKAVKAFVADFSNLIKPFFR